MSPYMMRVLRGKAVRQMARRVERALSSNHGEKKRGIVSAAQAQFLPSAYDAFKSNDYSKFKPSIIVPKFWDGNYLQSPETYQIDCSHYDMTLAPEEHPDLVARMHDLYNRSGCVLLTNTGLCAKTKDAMQKWSNVLMPSTMKYEGGANSREALNLNLNNVYETGAPLSAYLHYHHEMAYVKESVDRLCFMAVNVPEDPVEPLRGASYLSDNLKVTDYLLTTEMGQKLKKYGICYIRCLTDKEGMANSQLSWKDIESGKGEGTPIYNHWQDSFGVETQEEAEIVAARKGLKVDWGPNRYMKTRFYVSGFEYFPQADKNVLYSSIADNGSWFDTWPGMEQLPDMEHFNTANETQKPLLITYGNDEMITPEDLAVYTDAYDRFGFPVGGLNGWRNGDIVTFCNYRFAHGRPGIQLLEGQRREIGVMLGPMYTRVGSKPDKW